MATFDEINAMRQAIDLSALGLGTTSPTPPVGCVILDRHGRRVGGGYRQRKGEPHAEWHALAEGHLVETVATAPGFVRIITRRPDLPREG